MTLWVVGTETLVLLGIALPRRVWLGLMSVALLLPASTQAQPKPSPKPPPFVEQWSGWENLGGTIFNRPECVSSQAKQIDCFGVQFATIVHKQLAQNVWSNWTVVNGVVPNSVDSSRLDCVSWGPNHVDCFVRRDDNTIFRRTYDAGFDTGWEALGGSISTELSCVSSAVRNLDCFGRGTDGQLFRNSFNGDIWSGWTGLGGQLLANTKPSCVVFRGSFWCITVSTSSQIQVYEVQFTGGGTLITLPSTNSTVQSIATNDPSFRCVVAPGVVGVNVNTSKIECFATMIAADRSIGRWIFDGINWSMSVIGTIPATGGLLTSYDFDCVAQQGERVDCVDLIGHTDGSTSPPMTTSLTFRHVQLDFSTSANWQNVSLTMPPGTGFPALVRCTSWGPQRLDCFAAGQNLTPTPLLHASLSPQPLHHPTKIVPP
jgi:hypothetical protein